MLFVYTLLPGAPKACIAVFPDTDLLIAQEYSSAPFRDLRFANWKSGQLPDRLETMSIEDYEKSKL